MSQIDRIRDWLDAHPRAADFAALLTLTLLWALYFWRVLTPDSVNQVSLPEGDFSGQFVAFGAYQARRLLAVEVPLWNPYNYGGLPFIADTQAAVFYLPRLITIFVSEGLFDGWSYTALQAEAITHVWFATILTYLFVRTATASRIGGMVAGLVAAFGGYTAGYPPLQLAVLEAGVWLPLMLLGIFRASEFAPYESRRSFKAGWLALTALALGLSLMAGHPQTSLFCTYLIVAYFVHRAVVQRIQWQSAVIAVVGTLVIGYGLAAVQLLPGFEYTALTTRAEFGFDALSGGFPFSDLITFFIPNVLTTWSPLYMGIATLALAAVAIGKRAKSAGFWAVVALVALVISFGGKALPYRVAYLSVPGFAMFRGQERAAFIITYSLAILAGMGVASLLREKAPIQLRRGLGIAAAITWLLALVVFLLERSLPEAALFTLLQAVFFLALISTLTWAVIGLFSEHAARAGWSVALLALVVFDLFSITMGTNWEAIPASERDLLSSMADPVLADTELFRIDAIHGFSNRGPGENYGTLVGVQDIRGTSPLRLAAVDSYLTLPHERLLRLLSVKYVFTDWEQLPLPTTIIGENNAITPPAYLHEVTSPFPRAWLAHRVMVTPDDGQAIGWMSDPSFDLASTVVLAEAPNLDLPAEPNTDGTVNVTSYEPERITLKVATTSDAVLVLSEWDYPGWTATVNGERQSIWRANAGLRALPLEAGEYEIVFEYRPLSVRIGAMISLGSVIALIATFILGRRR